MVEISKVKAPSALLIAMEGRALFELGSYFAMSPLMRRFPKGDGHPVLVLPGFGGGDGSTSVLRRFLRNRGYKACPWKLGRNLGLRDGVLEGMLDRIDTLFEKHKRKISLVGWSLGGIYARELAKLRPDAVRMVISLGSPHSGDPKATNVWRFYEMAAGHTIEEAQLEMLLHKAPPVPTTSVYTKTDGIVAWQNCHQTRPINLQKQKQTENIIVSGSHCGLGFNPSALYVVADRLALPEGDWEPFKREGSRRMFFDTPSFEEGIAVEPVAA